VEGIVLDIDSPGGEVAGCFDLVDRSTPRAASSRSAAILSEHAFSRRLRLASAVDPGCLYVPRTGGTGSVGVIYIHLSVRGRAGQGRPQGHPRHLRRAEG
jgi:ClpP class serine protease